MTYLIFALWAFFVVLVVWVLAASFSYFKSDYYKRPAETAFKAETLRFLTGAALGVLFLIFLLSRQGCGPSF